MNTVTNYSETVKYENRDKLVHILSLFDSFHIEMSFMSIIYKRLKESNIEDLPVETGIIAQGSVVQVLRGGHYNRATRLYKLFYETMLRILRNHGKKNNLVPPTHFNDLFKSIGNTVLNSETRFLAFQSILKVKAFQSMLKICLRCRKAITI